MLAELPIRRPWRAIDVGLERQRVDLDRLPAQELDVERTGLNAPLVY